MIGVAAAATTAKFYVDRTRSLPGFPCRMLGPSRDLGHKIRNREISLVRTSEPAERKKVVIVGGGIAGLSAGWWLQKQGIADFVILELEKEPGGNSAAGKNGVSAYPWGAHYIPLANTESEYVRIFFEETGIIESYDSSGQPVYNELYLCHEPQDRLLKDGVFSEGLVPKRGLQPDDKDQIARFFLMVDKFREAIGVDGKPAFAIPLEHSSQEKKWLDLDAISMADWLDGQRFTSKPLRWYIDYCCRDDYGSTSARVSAWAGIHYFAGRKGTASNAEMNWVVTWPEGNGFVANKLHERLADRVRTNRAVVAIETKEEHPITRCVDDAGREMTIESDFVIFAAPRFIAPYIISGYDKSLVDKGMMQYAPWLVANITLTRIPKSRGAELAWDNVSYRSSSLGYVVATHQNITTRQGPLVITYYHPLSEDEPAQARQKLLSKPAEAWSEEIVQDLEKMHPGIAQDILSIDLWPWGHGMIRPSPGYIWGEFRQKLLRNQGNIYFAHSDMSGISNFEEAQFRGIEAAKNILAELGETS